MKSLSKVIAGLLLAGLFFLPEGVQAQKPFQLIRRFEGNWEGTGGGEPGTGKYERTYRFILSGKYLECRNKSVYPPKPGTSVSEVHEDIGIFSFDRSTGKLRLRQFHVEGFVNEYEMINISNDSTTFSFETTAIENIPKGWKAKETYQWNGSDQFTEIFELAEPGKEYQVYTRVTLIRKK